MIDLKAEELLSFSVAAKRLPPNRHGKCVHVSTLHRWATSGIGPDRITLETVRLGGMRLTSAEALWRFIARCTEAINRNRTATAIDIGRRGFAEQSEEGLERDSI